MDRAEIATYVVTSVGDHSVGAFSCRNAQNRPIAGEKTVSYFPKYGREGKGGGWEKPTGSREKWAKTFRPIREEIRTYLGKGAHIYIPDEGETP